MRVGTAQPAAVGNGVYLLLQNWATGSQGTSSSCHQDVNDSWGLSGCKIGSKYFRESH